MNDTQKIRVIILDDHSLFRIGLKATFHSNHPDIEIVGEAESGHSFFKILENTPADLVLLDINLPDIGGREIATRLRNEYPEIKILAVSAENTNKTIEDLIYIGIDGFISKQQSDEEELSNAIHAVMNGLEYFGRDITSIIYDLFVAKKKTNVVSPEFTEREKEIILLSKNGLQYKEIAEKLNISFHTVNSHKKNIFMKIGINNTMEMVQYALKHGIINIS